MKNKFFSNFKDIIIHEDEDYIVINKPAHISSLEDRFDSVNLLSESKKYFSESQLNHRLDKETSGVLVIAKNPEAYRNFSIQLENRKVKKIYHAISWGLHDFKELLIEAPLEVKSMGKVLISKQGKYSATVVKTLKLYSKNSLLECSPITGKKHQIRIHLSSAKAPIIADELYGGEKLFLSNLKSKYKAKETAESPLIDRFALHAYSIEFQDMKGNTVNYTASYPKDFERVIKILEKYC